MKNTGTKLEEYTQLVYKTLLNMRDEGIVVERRKIVMDRFGIDNEIDVYYEFAKANIIHRVAIECKDIVRPLDLGKVREFCMKISDIGDIIGVIVSKSGYHPNAKRLAEHHRILALTYNDLPQINMLLAYRIEKFFLPDEYCVAQPFWTVMEMRNGQPTGSYLGSPTQQSSKPIVSLFFSRKHAEEFWRLAEAKAPGNWAVRGLEQRHLRSLILTAEIFGWEIAVFYWAPNSPSTEKWIGIKVTTDELKEHFYVGDIPIATP